MKTRKNRAVQKCLMPAGGLVRCRGRRGPQRVSLPPACLLREPSSRGAPRGFVRPGCGTEQRDRVWQRVEPEAASFQRLQRAEI